MKTETNWDKHVAIGTYIVIFLTLILICLTALTFVHPPDPQHPMSLDSLSRTFAISPLLAGTILLVVALLAAIIARRLPAKPLPPLVQTEIANLFDVHPTSLDSRIMSPTSGVGYTTAKLRLSLENVGTQQARVLSPRWLCSVGNVSVQCGNSPYPNEPYQPGMMEFSYRYQFEEYKGSWKADRWKKLSDGKDDEQIEVTVSPGQTFRIWVGLNPCVPHKVLEDRRKAKSLGTLVLPVVIGERNFDWKQEL